MASLRRVFIMSCGSRGDVQPYIAIALALQRKGYEVAIASNLNHAQFCREMGLQFFGVFADADLAIKETPSLLASMAEGATFKFMKGFDEAMSKSIQTTFDSWMAAVESFKPDLVVEGTLCQYYGAVANYMLRIPCVPVQLQATVFDPNHMIYGLPTLYFGLHKLLIKEFIMGIWDAFAKKTQTLTEEKFQKRPTLAAIMSRGAITDDVLDPLCPILICQSAVLIDAIFSVKAPPLYKFCGQVVLSQEQQAGDNFGGAEVAELKRFIEAGPKPVYCGWGSMTCRSPGYMVELVVRALALSGHRAVVLKGWANLTEESLRGATEDAALLEFARDRVFFATSAPHEWLFPRCACTVHHGGAGTTNTALRAGVPTVITPVFLDQYDTAHAVNKLGAGVGFSKQFQKITAPELADAIKRAATDTELQENAARLAETLRAEDGTSNTVTEIEGFWHDWVTTGKMDEHVESRVEAAKQRRFACY